MYMPTNIVRNPFLANNKDNPKLFRETIEVKIIPNAKFGRCTLL